MAKLTNASLKLLRSPHFFSDLLSALQKRGLVGEKQNALATYVVATSRIFEKPLCEFIKGSSGAGKNHLADCVLSFFPPSTVRTLTSASARSWNYLGESFAHTIVYVKEQNEMAGPMHPARLLISEGKLVHYVTVKKRGRLVVERRVTKGPIASISTTTQDRLKIDDETRQVSIWVDESPEQTKKIIKGVINKPEDLSNADLKIWQGAQREIQKRANLPIEFPEWFKQIGDFVQTDNLSVRRYFPAFMQTCETVTLIRSFLGDQNEIRLQKKVVMNFRDFAITSLIFNSVFSQSLNRGDDQDLETQECVRDLSKENGGKGVLASEFARKMNLSSDRAYARLRKARNAGTIVRTNPPSKGNPKLYLPAKPRQFLPDPAEVFQKLEGLPERVKFVNPVTGEWVTYRRKRHD